MSYTRFAIYYIPPLGPLADFGAWWLGWDVATGRPDTRSGLPGLERVTRGPRKYGFHGTLKPPFRLRAGTTPEALHAAVARMAENCAPARADALTLSRIGRFLALTPAGDTGGIARIAATSVEELDGFRAPPDASELARRRGAGLSDRQEALLRRWGYPYVMDEFRFHLTLTGRLEDDEIDTWLATAGAHLPDLPAPFALDEVALVGEREDGFFELIHRYALSG